MSTAPTRGTGTRRQVLRTTAFAAAGLERASDLRDVALSNRL